MPLGSMVLIEAVVSDIWVRKKPLFLPLKCNIYLGKQRSWLILVPNHQFMQLHFGCALVVGVGIISLVCVVLDTHPIFDILHFLRPHVLDSDIH